MKFRVEVEPIPSLVPPELFALIVYNDDAKKGSNKLWCGYYDRRGNAEYVKHKLEDVLWSIGAVVTGISPQKNKETQFPAVPI
jgi:hypothetical protein